MKTYPSEAKDKEVIDVIRRMAHIAEYRETDASNHRERVRGYCSVIARHLGLSSQEVEIISFASLLHDVGKISLPESLLSKSGDFTAYEWELMKQHTTVGASLLKGSPSVYLQAAEIIALTHHERWDGSGYPKGLRGEEIPMSGRICALADVFDALTTKRNYKEEIPVESATNLVKESSGQLFDPRVVEIFMDNCEEILKIRSTELLV